MKEDLNSTMMGRPFHGMGLYGYEIGKHQYTSVWMDDMSTNMIVTAGNFDKSGKALTTTGTYFDPVRNRTVGFKEVLHFVNNNTHKLELFDEYKPGKWFKMMESTYTRAKS